MELSSKIIPYPLMHQRVFRDGVSDSSLDLQRENLETFAAIVGLDLRANQINITSQELSLSKAEVLSFMTDGYCLVGDPSQPNHINLNYLRFRGTLAERANQSLEDALLAIANHRADKSLSPIKRVRAKVGSAYVAMSSFEKDFWVSQH